MSDFLGNQNRQKMDAELQITSPHKHFKNWKDVDETKLALAIEIPYFLLTNGMGKSLAKPILQPLSLTNFTYNVWWVAQIIFNNTETKPTQQHLHTWKCTWTAPRCSNIIQTLRSHIKDLQKKDPSFAIDKPVKIKISGDGAKMSRSTNFLILSFCLLQTGKKVMLKGNRTTAIVNGPEKYDTLEHSFSLVINDINCETAPLGALLNFEWRYQKEMQCV